MAYTDIDKPSDYFNTVLYTGNGGTQAVTGVGFKPDFVWLKSRNNTYNHFLYDVVRGQGKFVQTDSESAEGDSDQMTSFDNDGFTVTATGGAATNGNGSTTVAWNWLADTSFSNDASSTGIGSIDSVGSFNNTNGCSIVTYTGTGSNGTVKHGLNTAPYFIAIRSRSTAGSDWHVYHNSLGGTKFLRFNTTATAETNSAAAWNNTAPTSSVFSLGTGNNVNGSSRTYIAYCFAEKQGYSKFGSYTGNGGGAANGNFIYTGFSPAFVMIKNTTHTYNWVIQDNKRNTFNPLDRYIYPNTSGAEAQNSIYDLDLLSNGFKVRSQRSETNDTNNGYIFMCFAENPFVTSTGVPATAR